MALCVIALELCGGWQACLGSGAAVSVVSELVDVLGWLLALAQGVVTGGADLDPTGSMLGVPPQPRVNARRGLGGMIGIGAATGN
jgi:hypothetical protein